MFDIITLGSATIDTFVDTKKALFQKKIPFGTKIKLDTLRTFTGGGGTNTAVAFARLGLRTSYMGAIGDDIHGHAILKELHKEGVDTRHCSHSGETGQSIILDSTGNDRIILTYKGANDNWHLDSDELEKIKTRWIYSSSLTGRSFITMQKVFAHAKMHGIKTAWNPSAYQIKEDKDQVIAMLALLDALIFNKEEADLLLGKHDIKRQLGMLISMGLNHAVITDGKKGAYYNSEEKLYHSHAAPAKVVETTGAGDAFASGYIYGLVKGLPEKTCAQIGMNNSASVISHHGAKNILLNHRESIRKKVKTDAI